MNIPTTSWYYRVYSWWERDKYGYDKATHLNLCPFVRVVLFWSWLRYCFNFVGKTPGTWLRLAANTITYLSCLQAFNWFLSTGGKSTILEAWGIEGSIAAMILILIGISRLVASYESRRWEQRAKLRAAAREAGLPEPVPFSAVVGAWLRTQHTKICPSLTLIDPVVPAAPAGNDHDLNAEW